MNPTDRYTFPKEDTDKGYLDGFWGWVALLESGDYERAAISLNHNSNSVFDAESLKDRVQDFFGRETPLTVVIPNDRLVRVINESADIAFPTANNTGWMMAQIPLTNEPDRAKEDDVMLMGAAISLFVVPVGDRYGFEFEIFHA